jgi:transposase
MPKKNTGGNSRQITAQCLVALSIKLQATRINKDNKEKRDMNFRNRFGGVYDNGKEKSGVFQEECKSLYQIHESFERVSRIMRCDARTVSKIVKGKKKTLRPYSRKLDTSSISKIESILYEKPSITCAALSEILKQENGIQVTPQRINQVIRERLGYSYKRISHIARQRKSKAVIDKRKFFKDHCGEFINDNIVFIDESHFDFRDFNPTYGYFPVGQDAETFGESLTRSSYSLLMGISFDQGIVHHIIKKTQNDGVNRHDFIYFMEELLAKIGSDEDSLIVLDNAKIHHSTDAKDFFDYTETPHLFLPPYSPDLNPIELVFGDLKRRVKENHTENMEQSIQDQLNAIPKENIQAYICHGLSQWQNKDKQ